MDLKSKYALNWEKFTRKYLPTRASNLLKLHLYSPTQQLGRGKTNSGQAIGIIESPQGFGPRVRA